jgi:hypothetical protein
LLNQAPATDCCRHRCGDRLGRIRLTSPDQRLNPGPQRLERVPGFFDVHLSAMMF